VSASRACGLPDQGMCPMPDRTNIGEGQGDGWDERRRREAERVLQVFAARRDLNIGRRYSLTSTAYLMTVQERERHLLEELGRRGWEPRDLEWLDVGCGAGGELARLIGDGADPGRLHGVDLRPDAIASARSRLPLCDLMVGDATDLPFATSSMDVVLQFTVLSSILDDEVRASVAAEMIRVCRPAGLIVSYDFTLNPTNADTKGLRARDIRQLFRGCEVTIHQVTLAPPIARRLAPVSRRLAALAGTIRPQRTHLMAFVTPPPDPVGLGR
jgi:SAM-dependent methyltransferase